MIPLKRRRITVLIPGLFFNSAGAASICWFILGSFCWLRNEDRRGKLREIELKVVRYQDDLESGFTSRISGMSVSEQVQEYREHLLRKVWQQFHCPDLNFKTQTKQKKIFESIMWLGRAWLSTRNSGQWILAERKGTAGCWAPTWKIGSFGSRKGSQSSQGERQAQIYIQVKIAFEVPQKVNFFVSRHLNSRFAYVCVGLLIRLIDFCIGCLLCRSSRSKRVRSRSSSPGRVPRKSPRRYQS